MHARLRYNTHHFIALLVLRGLLSDSGVTSVPPDSSPKIMQTCRGEMKHANKDRCPTHTRFEFQSKPTFMSAGTAHRSIISLVHSHTMYPRGFNQP
jgi:hypothetical protein